MDTLVPLISALTILGRVSCGDPLTKGDHQLPRPPPLQPDPLGFCFYLKERFSDWQVSLQCMTSWTDYGSQTTSWECMPFIKKDDPELAVLSFERPRISRFWSRNLQVGLPTAMLPPSCSTNSAAVLCAELHGQSTSGPGWPVGGSWLCSLMGLLCSCLLHTAPLWLTIYFSFCRELDWKMSQWKREQTLFQPHISGECV